MVVVFTLVTAFKITTIDCRHHEDSALLNALREKLSPRGNIVSEAGKQRTIELFGAPLSPQQVVEKICGDVRMQELPAVLAYIRGPESRWQVPEMICQIVSPSNIGIRGCRVPGILKLAFKGLVAVAIPAH